MAGRLRALGNANVSLEKESGEKYRHLITFGRMLPCEKIVVDPQGEWFTAYLTNGDILRDVKAEFFEFHGNIDVAFETKEWDQTEVDEVESVDIIDSTEDFAEPAEPVDDDRVVE